VSCSFQILFIQEAVTHALDHPNFHDCDPNAEMGFMDLPSDEWNEKESNEDDPLHEEDELNEEDFNPRSMEMLGKYVDYYLR